MSLQVLVDKLECVRAQMTQGLLIAACRINTKLNPLPVHHILSQSLYYTHHPPPRMYTHTHTHQPTACLNKDQCLFWVKDLHENPTFPIIPLLLSIAPQSHAFGKAGRERKEIDGVITPTHRANPHFSYSLVLTCLLTSHRLKSFAYLYRQSE